MCTDVPTVVDATQHRLGLEEPKTDELARPCVTRRAQQREAQPLVENPSRVPGGGGWLGVSRHCTVRVSSGERPVWGSLG